MHILYIASYVNSYCTEQKHHIGNVTNLLVVCSAISPLFKALICKIIIMMTDCYDVLMVAMHMAQVCWSG